jgi:hypothetical protein
VAVTRPARRETAAPRPGGREIDEQTRLGISYMGSLVRTQLRAGLATLAAVIVPLAILPLLVTLVPALGRLAVAGVPVMWLLLGVAVYPLMVLAGWRYIRQAERNEAEFERIVTRR